MSCILYSLLLNLIIFYIIFIYKGYKYIYIYKYIMKRKLGVSNYTFLTKEEADKIFILYSDIMEGEIYVDI